MNYYNLRKEEVIDILKSNEKGLSSKDVQSNQKKYGLNELNIKKKKPIIVVFLEQFKDILVLILIVSAIISIFTSSIESAIVIMVVLLINAIIGTIQYSKAEKTLESLKSLSSPTVKIMRDGKTQIINSKEITIGDVIILSSGDVICADGRVIESDGLEVSESSITGESASIEKRADVILKKDILLAEQKNMVFSSSKVLKGSGKYIVTAVGMNSEIGKITSFINQKGKTKSPLQNSLDKFSRYLAGLILIICAIVFGINIYRSISFIDSLMFSVSLAVAAIPEALGAIVTIVLAVGTRELAINKAVMKDIRSVETLGAVSHVFSDKTGTITTGELVIHSIYNGVNEVNKEFPKELLDSLIYCNLIDDNIIKDHLEKCIYDYLQGLGHDIIKYKNCKKISYLNFDSERKMMSVSLDNMIYLKGSPEKILEKSNYYYDNKQKKYLDDFSRTRLNKKLDEYTRNGFRVIAYGSKGLYKTTHDYTDEENITFLGFVSFYDPPRENVDKAIDLCKKAGVTPIMITGDNVNTAKYIAKKIGLYKEKDDLVLTGKDLQEFTDEQLLEKIEQVKIYARVTPSDKIKIVELMQKKGKIVAMTGDGVNDAPALKKANVGISMGLKGTEVAKDASTLILTDDNFYTIINSIGIGRKIYANIQNAIRFLLAGNLAGILIVLISSALMLPIPFAPVHLLFINLITDSLPAIGIGLEKTDDNYLKQKPRNIKENILSKKVICQTLIEASLITSVVLVAYFIGLKINQYYAQTNSFIVLCLARLIYSINCRKDKSVFKQRMDNHLLNISILLGVVLISLITFIPFLKNIFAVSNLSILDYLILFGLSIVPTIVIQIFNIFKSKK